MKVRAAALGVLLSISIGSACEEPEPAPSCEVDRDCQNGDLCDGDERCVLGQCEEGLPPLVPPRSCEPDSDCHALCNEDERCLGESCVSVCLPPVSPILTHMPVGAVLEFPEGTLAELSPTANLASSRGRILTFPTPGTFMVEARWESPPAGCEAAFFRAEVEAFEASPRDPMTAPDAIAFDDPRLIDWAAGFVPPRWGKDLSPEWQDPTLALGPATGLWDDATSLGNDGAMTLVFEPPIADVPGPDIAVFENGFSELFLELAWVEVSSNGVDFVRFASLSSQEGQVSAYGTLDPREVMGVAGRFEAGFGTTLDLATLLQDPLVLTKRVDLSAITHVRVVDIVGDGTAMDSFGHPIFDPTPTYASAGFDLEAIGVIAPLVE